MKRLVRCSLLFLMCLIHHAVAAGIVRIANGDCSALRAAVAAAQNGGPAMNIVLANRGSYDYCPIAASGNVAIDGAGSTLQVALAPDVASITVAAGATASIRNLNLVPTPAPIPPVLGNSGCGLGFWPFPMQCAQEESPTIENHGSLLLDSVSESGVPCAYGRLMYNTGDLTLRNTSIVSNSGCVIFNIGNLQIRHSTITANETGNSGALATDGPGLMTVANSVIANNSGPNCHTSSVYDVPKNISLGGNVTDDTDCGFDGPQDQVVADIHSLDFGTHGGVVGTLALDYDSPAIGNGLAANCEATDARGLARGQSACDSGAYEVGGGDGKLSATGMSGLYFNASNNGHYVSIQRLYGNDALVIWNTFDQHGTPAWLYGVGTVAGNKIHVDQVAQNVGGTLHAGGGVTGATPTLWGTFDVDLSDCYTASLSYSSPLPQFGSGSTSLQRLAFLDGVNCAR